MKKEQTVNLSCSFCGKSQREVKKLIAGPKVYICDECIGLCIDIIGDEKAAQAWAATYPGDGKAFVRRILQDGSDAAERLDQFAKQPDSSMPVHIRAAIGVLVSTWARLRILIESP